MISRMMRLVNQTDSLHLTPPQQKDVLDYARSLPRRFAAARAVEAAEGKLIEATLGGWADAGDPAELGWADPAGDLRAVVRAAALGLLTDDPGFADLRAAGTLRRALGFLDVPPDAADGLFDALRSAAAAVLPPDAADLLAEYLPGATAPATA